MDDNLLDGISSIELVRERKNSTVLRRYKISNPEFISRVVEFLYLELVKHYDLIDPRKSSVDKLKHHIRFFVTNLYAVSRRDPTKYIAFSKNGNVYSDSKSKYKKVYELSYRFSVEQGEEGKGVIPFLEHKGYIEVTPFKNDRTGQTESFQSRMRATGKLMDLIDDLNQQTDADVEIDTIQDELIVVKGVKPKPRKVTKIKDGKRKTVTIKSPRKVCKTPDKPVVRQMRENLKLINCVLEEADIWLDITDEQMLELRKEISQKRDRNSRDVDFNRKTLHRVFLDRLLDLGGRFYGPWYQNIPKKYREYIRINDAPTLELDYSALHPNLLYALRDLDPPDPDPYRLDGYSEETRKFMKAMFLRMINATSRSGAKGSIRETAFYERKRVKGKEDEKPKVTIPEELGNLDDKYLDPLLDKFIEKHKQIEDDLFKGYGNLLMYIDSQIAEKVLLYFAHKNVPVLALHDGFRIDSRLFDELKQVMHEIIYVNFKRYIPISNDDLQPLLESMLVKMQQNIDEGIIDGEEVRSFMKDVEARVDGLERQLKALKARLDDQKPNDS